MSARAVILAGGRGTRLRPYTVALPKPLVPIDDRPILEIVIRQLAASGFDHVTLAVNHLAELLQAFFGDGRRWNLKIDYSLESKPLNTMGPLRLISDLPDNFLVMNGDILTDLNFRQFLARHVDGGRLFTIAASRREQKIDYGVLEESDGHLSNFLEKPAVPYLVSMGVYCLSKRVLDFIPFDQSYGFDQLMLELLAKKEPVNIDTHHGYWLDIGRPDDYQKATDDWPALSARLGV